MNVLFLFFFLSVITTEVAILAQSHACWHNIVSERLELDEQCTTHVSKAALFLLLFCRHLLVFLPFSLCCRSRRQPNRSHRFSSIRSKFNLHTRVLVIIRSSFEQPHHYGQKFHPFTRTSFCSHHQCHHHPRTLLLYLHRIHDKYIMASNSPLAMAIAAFATRHYSSSSNY